MALDYGARTVGVALSDESLTIAQPLEIVRRERESMIRHTLARIETLAAEYGVTQIVVGLPLNMDDSEGERAQAARAFGVAVQRRTGLPVVWQDERLTTVRADEIMDEMGLRDRRERKEHVDAIAASVILEEYLNRELHQQ